MTDYEKEQNRRAAMELMEQGRTVEVWPEFVSNVRDFADELLSGFLPERAELMAAVALGEVPGTFREDVKVVLIERVVEIALEIMELEPVELFRPFVRLKEGQLEGLVGEVCEGVLSRARERGMSLV